MELEGRENRGPYTKAKLKKIFSSWKIWLLTILYMYVGSGEFVMLPTLTNTAHSTMGLQAASRCFNSMSSLFLFSVSLTAGCRYLKYSKDPVYSVSQINAYPTTTNAVQVVTTLIYACMSTLQMRECMVILISIGTSDTILNGRRWPPIIFGAVCHFPLLPEKIYSYNQVINIVCYVSLAIWNIPVGWKWTCYILAGCGYGLSGLLMAYV